MFGLCTYDIKAHETKDLTQHHAFTNLLYYCWKCSNDENFLELPEVVTRLPPVPTVPDLAGEANITS